MTSESVHLNLRMKFGAAPKTCSNIFPLCRPPEDLIDSLPDRTPFVHVEFSELHDDTSVSPNPATWKWLCVSLALTLNLNVTLIVTRSLAALTRFQI